MASNQPIMPK
ncbi:hypothetical protein L150_02245, partial [Candida albicans Ca529L]